MSLTKVKYKDYETIITAQNLNDIQDNIIALNKQIVKNPKNLLINSNFKNPVNSQGKMSYNKSGYIIDKWVSNSNQSVNLSNDGIIVTGAETSIVLSQTIIDLPDGIYTAVIKTNNALQIRQYKKVGTVYTKEYDEGEYLGGYIQLYDNLGIPTFTFRVDSGYTVTVEWVALYSGGYTIENLPEYLPKNYEEELLICTQYSPFTGNYLGIQRSQPKNLLDNSDFTNPVNQRGQTSYTNNTDATVWGIDRWHYGGGTLTLQSDSINFTSNNSDYYKYIAQHLDTTLYANEKYTLALKLKINEISGPLTIHACDFDYEDISDSAVLTINDTTTDYKIFFLTFTTPSDITRPGVELYMDSVTSSFINMDIKWIALYKGEYNVYTLPEYQPKGYGNELLECMRYFIYIPSTNGSFPGYNISTTQTRVNIDTPVIMRTTPEVTFSNFSACKIHLYSSTKKTPTKFAVSEYHLNKLTLDLTSSGLTTAATAALVPNTSSITLNAELIGE